MDTPPALEACVVLPSATRGGAEIWQERLAAASTRVRWQVVGLADGPALDPWRTKGDPVTTVSGGRRTRGAARTVVELARHLRTTRPDLVVGHGVKAGGLAAVAGHRAGVRSTWVRHDDSFDALVPWLDRLTDGQVSTSARLTRERTHEIVVPPPTAGIPRDRAGACAQLGLPTKGERLRLVMATRLVPHKGVDDAITALVDAPGWELHVHGLPDAAHPDEPDRLAALARDLGVTDQVHLGGPVDDIGLLLAAYDVAAVITRPGAHLRGESFSMLADEAVAAGVPVIAAPPVSERLGAATLAVPAGDPGALAAALRECSSPVPRAALTAAGRSRVLAGSGEAGTCVRALERCLATIALRPGAGLGGERPISVVTTVLDESVGLRALLDLLLPQLRADDELVVVDGGSTDGTAETAEAVATSDPRVTVVVEPGAGISAGRNIGIRAARHDLIACTDVGCDPRPGWLEAFRSAAADRPEAGLLTGVYDVDTETVLHAALAVTSYPFVEEVRHPTPWTRVHGRLFGRSFDPTMPTGRSVAFTREAWAGAGGFPEHLATGEDVTFGQAVARRHPAVLVTDARVLWRQRETLSASLKMYYRYGLGSGHSRDRRLLARDAIRAGAIVGGAVALAAGGPRTRVAALLGTAAYLSVPIERALHSDHPVATVTLVPAVSALRDLTKVAGAVVGLVEGPPATPGAGAQE